MFWGWLGALLSYCSLLIGFYLKAPVRPPRRLLLRVSHERLHRLGQRLCQVGLLMFALVTGPRLIALFNPIAASNLIDSGLSATGLRLGALTNYFNYAVNLLIPGVCLMYAAWLRQRSHSLSLFLWLFVAFSVYTSLGFRYRIILLVIPMLLLWYLHRRRRPSLVFLAFVLSALISISGLIVLTRSYGAGLNLSAVEDTSSSELFSAGFGDSAVFLSSSGVIDQAPSVIPFVGPEPFLATLRMPIPRQFLPDKHSSNYFLDSLATLYGGKIFADGAFFLNYAEYYLVAGWPSLVFLSVVFGLLLRRLWNWFVVRKDEPFAQAIYTLVSAYLFMVVSRGYLPQITLLFAFSVAPLFWLYGRWSDPVSFGRDL
jgi:hypothetical protein